MLFLVSLTKNYTPTSRTEVFDYGESVTLLDNIVKVHSVNEQ